MGNPRNDIVSCRWIIEMRRVPRFRSNEWNAVAADREHLLLVQRDEELAEDEQPKEPGEIEHGRRPLRAVPYRSRRDRAAWRHFRPRRHPRALVRLGDRRRAEVGRLV